MEGWTAAWRYALRVTETRRELATLDERLLRDVGVTSSEARMEARRAPWDLRHQRG
ncbi:MAG TPA: DUF1127 domain-containing protein [Roseomonas sp.]|nr:DUF1127 domain-containing protein [Roseomonas sp.]